MDIYKNHFFVFLFHVFAAIGNGASVFGARVTLCNPACCCNMYEVMFVCVVWTCVHSFSFTWIDMFITGECISYGGSWCVSLPFSHGKNDSEWRTHTQKNTHTLLIPTLCSPTVGRMKSFTWGAVGRQRLFCACTNTRTHTHTHVLTFLPVCGSREQSRLDWMHMWPLSAGGSGAFIIQLPSHSSNLDNSESCCVVTKSPLTL